MIRLKTRSTIVTFLCLSSILVLEGLILGNFTPSTYAEETEVNVNVPTTLAIASHTANVIIDADNYNQFYSNSATITSTTNNPTGYTLTMADKDTNTSLVNDDYDGQDFLHTIDSIASPITVDSTGFNFTVNKWGYAKDSATTTFLPIPASTAAEEIKVTNGPAENSTATVTFGTKVNSEVVNGAYEDTVVFSLTANALPLRDITYLNSMQDLARHPEYCANSAIGTTVLLPDTRDNKEYRIRKLADNNCWMIDSLRLGTVGQDIVLTQQNSDVSINTIIPSSAIQDVDNQGSWVIGSDPRAAEFYKNWHVFEREDTGYGGTKTNPTVSGNRFGSLYNWHTATAGTSVLDATQGSSVTSSICPKGWRLPDGYSASSVRSKTFQALYDNYDSLEKMTETTSGMGPEFVLSGLLSGGGLLSNLNTTGSYWTRTYYGWNDSLNRYRAYNLHLDSSIVGPQGVGTQASGFSIRCVSAEY